MRLRAREANARQGAHGDEPLAPVDHLSALSVFSDGAFSFSASSFLKSPMMPLSGHNLNAGHLLQPAAIAMGHKVICILLVRASICHAIRH